MLQENSQKIRRYQIREAFNMAVLVASIVSIIALFFVGMSVAMNYFVPIMGWHILLVRSAIIAPSVVGTITIIVFLGGLGQDIPTGDWLTEVEAGTIILDKENRKVVEVQNEDVILTRSHPIFNERYQSLTINERQCVSVTVHPMTGNPKVRNITCKLILKVKEMSCENLQVLFDFLHLHEMWRVGRDYGSKYLGKTEVVWEDPVQSMLYDFCNAHSRELSELFNPMRKEQQEQFQKLVHVYFDPLLANSGLEIKSCSFLVS